MLQSIRNRLCGRSALTPSASGQPEIFTVDFTGHDGASFVKAGAAKSLTFSRAAGGTWYPWFIIDGVQSDPVTGTQGLQCPESVTASDSDMLQSFIDNGSFDIAGDWTVSVNGLILTFTSVANGARVDAHDIDTGMTITTTQQGS